MKKEWMGYYKFLENLRKNNVNMYGACSYLIEEYDLTRYEANEILMNWMDYYGDIIFTINSEKEML